MHLTIRVIPYVRISILHILVAFIYTKTSQHMGARIRCVPRMKGDYIPYPDLLQPVAILTQNWDTIIMNFIKTLPKFLPKCGGNHSGRYRQVLSSSCPTTLIYGSTRCLTPARQRFKTVRILKAIIWDQDEIFTRNFRTELFTEVLIVN